MPIQGNVVKDFHKSHRGIGTQFRYSVTQFIVMRGQLRIDEMGEREQGERHAAKGRQAESNPGRG